MANQRRIQRLLNGLDDILQGGEFHLQQLPDFNPQNAIKIRTLLLEIKAEKDVINDISEHVSGDQEEQMDILFGRSRRLKARLEGWLEEYQLKEQISVVRESQRQMDLQPQTISPPSNSIRLPVLQCPTFEGDILKWQEFWDSFEATIHMNKSLHEIEKFNYLKSLLSGEAKLLISGLAVTNANYEVAIDLLHKRYGNNTTIKEKLFNSLVSLPTPRTPHMLKNMTLTALQHLRALEALHYNVEENELSLLSILKPKYEFFQEQLLFLKETPFTNWKLVELLQAASTLADAKLPSDISQKQDEFRTSNSLIKEKGASVPTPNSRSTCRHTSKPIVASLIATKPTPICVFCNKSLER